MSSLLGSGSESRFGHDERAVDMLRRFWDDAARHDTIWHVDTSWYLDAMRDGTGSELSRFFEAGRTIVSDALDGAPAAPRRFERAVEIGAGIGRNCLALADRFEQVVGFDVSPEMVARARRFVPDRHVGFVNGDGSSLRPITDASVDFVLSVAVFQHIPRVQLIESYLREAARVLRSGGVLAFQWNSEVPVAGWRMRRALSAAIQWSGIHREPYRANGAEVPRSRVAVPRIQRVLEASGLCLQGVEGQGTRITRAWATRP
jgi:SAM-dependent methyltransferase